jgi:CubicO group peptidase (beta-lactamase class C family)
MNGAPHAALRAAMITAALAGLAAGVGPRPVIAAATPDATASVDAAASPDAAAIARGRRLELPTPYEPPPGNPLEHHAAGFAQIMCSAVFITGLDPEFAAENVGFFTAPYAERAKLGKPVIDRAARTVSVAVPGGVTRVARYYGDAGCITLEPGADAPRYTPKALPRTLPDPAGVAWPDGDAGPRADPQAAFADPALRAAGLDAGKVAAAMGAAFASPQGMTAAYVVTWRGRIIAERYAPGIGMHTPLESWSMGKSVTAALMGILIGRGDYRLMQPAPIPEWQSPGDPRAKIRIADLMRMSSGLRIRAPYDPDYDPAAGYPDHLYLYTGSVNSFHYAATRPLEWPPGTVGRYRNTDPVLVNDLIRLAVERHGEDYASFPRRALFDRIGVRSMVIETDPYGDLLTQGYDLASARDWARLGNLFLDDGVWKGSRILPPGFVKFVSTLAPAWVADGRPVYGGFFWINGDGALPIPKDSYYMLGAGGQNTIIVPSHDLVVVRLGHFRGDEVGSADLNKSLALLMQATPAHH